MMIPKPFYQDRAGHATHMTGYSYDSTVPIVFAGPGFKAGVYASEARVIDIAPTLSFALGIIPPATCEGHVLAEAIGD